MKSIREIAVESTTLSELMDGKTKITTEDIIRYRSNGITINDFDLVEYGENRYYVYTYEEDIDKFALSGFVLTRIFDSIVSYHEGDISSARAAISNEKLPVRLSNKKTKDGRTITNVEIL